MHEYARLEFAGRCRIFYKIRRINSPAGDIIDAGECRIC